MPLTSTQLVNLFAQPLANPRLAGRIAALRMHGTTAGIWSHERQLLDEIAKSVPTRRVAAAAGYDSPIRHAPSTPHPVPLTPSDLLWLQRLPIAPEDVSFEDASALSKLAGQVEPGSSDARLMTSIYEPVRRLHTGRVAEHALERLRATPIPEIPATLALSVLRDAIAREVPALSVDEVAARASAQFAEARGQATQERADKIDAARADVALAARPPNVADIAASAAVEDRVASAARFGDPVAARALADYRATAV